MEGSSSSQSRHRKRSVSRGAEEGDSKKAQVTEGTGKVQGTTETIRLRMRLDGGTVTIGGQGGNMVFGPGNGSDRYDPREFAEAWGVDPSDLQSMLIPREQLLEALRVGTVPCPGCEKCRAAARSGACGCDESELDDELQDSNADRLAEELMTLRGYALARDTTDGWPLFGLADNEYRGSDIRYQNLDEIPNITTNERVLRNLEFTKTVMEAMRKHPNVAGGMGGETFKRESQQKKEVAEEDYNYKKASALKRFLDERDACREAQERKRIAAEEELAKKKLKADEWMRRLIAAEKEEQSGNTAGKKQKKKKKPKGGARGRADGTTSTCSSISDGDQQEDAAAHVDVDAIVEDVVADAVVEEKQHQREPSSPAFSPPSFPAFSPGSKSSSGSKSKKKKIKQKKKKEASPQQTVTRQQVSSIPTLAADVNAKPDGFATDLDQLLIDTSEMVAEQI